MKFCPVVPEICRGQVHGARKERRIIIRRNGAKTISLPNKKFGRLNNKAEQKSKNNKAEQNQKITKLNKNHKNNE